MNQWKYPSAPQSLHEAAASGDLDRIEQLLCSPIDLDERDDSGRTAAHHAALNGRDEALRLLVNRGARVDSEDEALGLQPVHLAALGRHLGALKLLIARGADPDAGDFTPAACAAGGGHMDVLEYLLSPACGADPNAGGAGAAAAAGRFTPLQAAAKGGHLPAALLLLRRGAALDAATADGRQAHHLAAQYDRPAVLGALLDAGADVHAADSAGSTALHLAAAQGNAVAAQLLLARGARLDAANRAGRRPHHEAAAGGQADVLQVLLDHSSKSSSAPAPAPAPAVSSSSVSSSSVSSSSSAATAAAADGGSRSGGGHGGGSPSRKSLLLDAPDADGNTGAHLAAARPGSPRALALLLAAGARADAPNHRGRYPHHFAARGGAEGSLRLLIERFPQAVAAADACGCRASTYAAWGQHASCMWLLLEAEERWRQGGAAGAAGIAT
jgi:ankyrin repeat protein